jgi:hypothetical protein
MTPFYFVVIAMLGLSACVPAKQGSEWMADKAKNDVYHTQKAVKEWAMTPPPEPGALLPTASTYCYHAQTDVLCYRQPMPGWENRLIAYQGTNAVPPPPAVMQLLPKARTQAAQTPENRVAESKPVFNELPKQNADETKDPNAPAMPNSLNEQLPDPSQSPQL